MGTDDLFKKRRAAVQERRKEIRDPKPDSYLIVSEGAKTEPLYFDGIAKYINEKYGKSIKTEKPIIDTQGEGKSTMSLVEATSKIISRSPTIYNQVWVVFDKDDFHDFDEAIVYANELGYKVGWSNQSFEYWLYLHFNYSDAALHRSAYVEKLDTLFKSFGIEKGYQKNDPEIFNIVTTYGSLQFAVSNAEKVFNAYKPNEKPSEKCPCTTVQNLILELKPYIAELLSK